jgi:Ricin-type beta-trefoil lectin domain
VKKPPLFVGAMYILQFALSGCATSHQITAGPTNQCINVVNHGYPEAGVPLRVRPCDPWQNQQWALNKGATITGVGGFCVDVQGSAATEGSAIIYVPCDGRPSQKWAWVNGTLTGIGGKCIDIGGGEPATGAPLILATCNGSPSQQWIVH